MPSRATFVIHTFNGGWATDFGQTFYGTPGDGGLIQMPFLVDAKNVYYQLDGGPVKAGGTAKLNSATLDSGGTITSLYDYFRSGTGGATTQKRICTTSAGKLYKEDLDGVWDVLKTGLTATAVYTYATFDDILLIANDSGVDVPMSWDQTTFQNLAGTPPTGSLVCAHRNYAWLAGVPTLPSRLYYSVSSDPEDWTGVGSGSIDIDPDDGDRIVGLISHKNDLWVFKGPNRCSIHRITGSAPTGADAFARLPFIYGLGAVHQNMIFRFGDDIGFMSPWGTVHSLGAVNAYGDYNQSFLSVPIDTYVRTYLNLSRLKFGWAVNDPTHGYVLFGVPGINQSNNNQVLMMDYRFNPLQPRWALWDSFSWASAVFATDAHSRKRIFAGGYTGYVWKTDQDTRTNDGTAINEIVNTPYFTYGSEFKTKTLNAVSLGVVPYSTSAITFRHRRDGNPQQTDTGLTQGGGGGVFDTDLFDTGVFGGGGRFIPRFLELAEGGEFRSVQYTFEDTTNNSNLEVHNIGALVVAGGDSLEN